MLQRCRTCARCSGGRRCPYQDGNTKGCGNFAPRPNPYRPKDVKPLIIENPNEHWSSYKTTSGNKKSK